MISNSKLEFLIKQGYDKDVINVFVNCGVEKNLLWFLTVNKKGLMNNLDSEDIRTVNKYLEDCSDAIKHLALETKDKSQMYVQAIKQAYNYKRDLERKERNIIYRFENGYYISILNEQDLELEGKIMSNCIGGYRELVGNKNLGIIALKQPSKKTIVHIEIKKNGQLAQNYSKANTPIKNEYWKMILEFFEKNSKKVDFEKMFGDAYVTSSGGGYINSVSLCVPTSITYKLEDGIKNVDFNDAFELKRFSLDIPKNTEEIKFSEKSELTKWLQNKKNEILKVYDDLTEQINLTNSSDLYLSDEIKEKIFGSNKNAYLMKGENYNLSEINFQTSSMPGIEGIEEPMGEEQEVVFRRPELEVREDYNIGIVENNYRPLVRVRPVGGGLVQAFALPGLEYEPGLQYENNEALIGMDDRDEDCKKEECLDKVEFVGNYPDEYVNESNDPQDVDESNDPITNLVRGVYNELTQDEMENAEEVTMQEGDMVEVAVPNIDGTYEYIQIEPLNMYNDLEVPPAPFDEILRRAK